MYISDYTYHRPKSLREALTILNKSDNGSPLAGGTDLIVEIKKGLRYPSVIVSLTGIKELNLISEDKKNIYIGAATTHNDIIKSAVIKKQYPVIADALSKIGSEQVRNSATIGGNICTGASCCDSAPILMALNASVDVVNSQSVSTIPLKDFFVFNKKTILKKGEIVSRIIIPKPGPGIGAHFEKFGLREEGNISVVSVAVMVKVEKDICINACVVIGAVAPVPKISNTASAILKGKKISEFSENSHLLVQAGQAAVDDSVPIDDIRGGAEYRRDILKVLTKRAILKAIRPNRFKKDLTGF